MRKFRLKFTHFVTWSKSYGCYQICLIPNLSIVYDNSSYCYLIKLELQFLAFNLHIGFYIDKK